MKDYSHKDWQHFTEPKPACLVPLLVFLSFAVVASATFVLACGGLR